MGAKAEHVCTKCRTAWPKGDGGPAECPQCGHPVREPARIRFSLKGLLILAVLCLGAIIGAASARKKRADAEPAPGQADPSGGYPASAPDRSRVGAVPCGYCNGDGRIDDADLYRRDPPYIRAVSGSRCPACAGRGGVGK